MSIWHNYTLEKFNKEKYRKDLTFDGLIKEILYLGEPYWVTKVNKSMCLLPSEAVNSLPLRCGSPFTHPSNFQKVNLGFDVYYKIVNSAPIKVKEQKTFEPCELLNKFSDITHTNPFHYKLYKGLNLASWFFRVNCRVAAESEFGKSAVTKSLKLLTNTARIISPASFPALLRGLLTTRLLNITEPKHFDNFDTFLELAGDRDPSFENPKMGAAGYGLQNHYDISELSVILTYNPLKYYQEKNQEANFFDNMFRHHIQIRYLPFLFNGQIQDIGREELTEENYSALLEFLRNLYYYKNHWKEYFHEYGFKVANLNWGIRYNESFAEILKFFDMVSKDKNDFEKMAFGLLECFFAYNRMLNNDQTILGYELPKKVEEPTDEVIEVEEILDEKSPIDFIKGKGGEMDVDEFVKAYGDAELNKLLKNGDVFHPKPSLIKVLE